MRLYSLLPTVFATGAMVSALTAQEPRIVRSGPAGPVFGRGGAFNFLSGDQPQAVIGITTTSAATARDTLGVLVATVRPGSPAEKAGIEEGNRIASINGVSLKLAAADIGDEEVAGSLSRRLSRELDKLKPGDEVDLRVYAGGQTKAVKVKTMAPDDVYSTRSIRRDEDRATLGVNLAVTGSARDSLGVFVMSTEDGSAAAKAGIEEGSRIAAINGVDLRGTTRGDDGSMARTPGVSRLEREVSRLKPGDNVDLRVYYNGQYRNVKLTAGRLSDLPRRRRSIAIMSGDNLFIPPIAMRIDEQQIGDQVRRAVESAHVAAVGTLNGVSRILGTVGRRVVW